MTNCTYIDRWKTPFALLSDDEFEELLEHSAVCAHHARVLDEYNENGRQLVAAIIPDQIMPDHTIEITRGKVFALFFDLKWQSVREKIARLTGLPESGPTLFLFTALAAIGSLLVVRGSMSANLDIHLSVVVVSFIAATMFWQVIRNWRSINFMNNGTGALAMANGTENFSDYKNTYIGKVPARLQPRGIKEDEKNISLRLKEILRAGFNPETCQTCLDFLADNEAVVRRSWVHTLNRARFLRGTGMIEKSQVVVREVLREYSHEPEAIGTAYEVLSWFEELDYNEGGVTDKQLLIRRMNLITEGLKHYPTYYQLLINAFEVEQMIGSYSGALEYLNRLSEVDSEIAKQYFTDHKETEVMKESNWELKKTIESIGTGMRAKVQALVLILFMLTGLAGGMLFSYTQAAADKQLGRGDGTSVGIAKVEAKGGTSIGAT